MEKYELLNMMDEPLLEKLFGFCYSRTNDSYEAQELCSDIVYALIRAARSDGEIQSVYPFVWRIARNVYADYCRRRRQRSEQFYEGDAEEVLACLAQGRDGEEDARDADLLAAVYRQISFLTKAYREIMILFYLDGLSAAEIAARQEISETAVWQRLFSARRKVRKEVVEMNETGAKPVAFKPIEYSIIGMGNVSWGDPRTVCTRQFSRHVLWLCRRRPMSAAEIAKELNVPTLYVEEELELLAAGENGQYGLVRRRNSGKYGVNFILFDQKTMKEANRIYQEQIPKICRVLIDFLARHREAYLAFPYRNRNPEWNRILWQQLTVMADAFRVQVEKILKEQYFAGEGEVERPFSVFGYVGRNEGFDRGWNGVYAEHLCGYSRVEAVNVHCRYLRPRFWSGWNLATDPQLQLALRAIDGLGISALTEREKEQAAKAVESGYLYREGEMLYTRILVHDKKEEAGLFEVSRRLRDGYFDREAKEAAGKMAELIRRTVPPYLMAEWRFANELAGLPVVNGVAEAFIEQGILIPPAGGVGTEGCWMSVEPEKESGT